MRIVAKSLLITALILSASTLKVLADKADYRDGVFIVNEDWYGHQNSTINWISDSGEWTYRVFQQANADNMRQLGCTNQYGQIYGGRFFLIAKQEKDPGASVTGGRITVADARSMEMLYQSTLIDPSGNQCDGRGYLGVDKHKGYISSSNGIWVFDTDSYTVIRQVEGSSNPNGADGKPNTDPTGSLYHGQCGSMVRVNDRVFAAHQQYGLLVIDPLTDKVVDIVSMQPVSDLLPEPEEGKKKTMPGIGSVVLAKDGSLWVSIAKDVQGNGATLPYLMRVDPATLECKVINVPEGIYPPANSWYAWTPDGFCSSVVNNVLYWNGGPNSWFSNARVFRYDIDKNEFSIIVNLDQEAEIENLDQYSRWNIYGCSMRIHPVTDELYMSLFHYFQNPTYRLRKTDHTGKTIAEYDMIQNYWFPSLPVFPDNYLPEIHNIGVKHLGMSGVQEIDLTGFATDKDNLESAIVISISNIEDESAFTAKMTHGKLEITPLSPIEDKEYKIRLSANSNGEIAEGDVCIVFSSSGISEIPDNDIDEKWITISGFEIKNKDNLAPGIYIVKKGNSIKK